MSYSRLKIWFIVSFTFGVIAVVIRAIRQIVVIPTSGTMLIFIPLILVVIGVNALVIYLAVNPQKLKSPPILVGIAVALTVGFIAGAIHFAHFIPSPEADPILSKIIVSFVMLASVSGYLLVLRIIWSALRAKRR